MMNELYEVVVETMEHEDEGIYTAYSIACRCDGENVTIRSISSELAKVEQLVRALNIWELPMEQFRDTVGAWLGE